MSTNGSHANALPFDVLRKRVGATPLVEAKTLARQLRIPNLFLKDETKNPTGSIHDRFSLAHVDEALRVGCKTVSFASQDPGAASLAVFARAAGLECVVHVPEAASPRWAVSAQAAGATVVRVKGGLAKAQEASREAAASNQWYDASPPVESNAVRNEAFSALAKEIVAGLGAPPAAVAVPTREGSVVAGLWSGFETLNASPRLIAATSKMGNPIVWSLAQGEDTCTDLDERHVFPSATSEPLATYKSADGTPAVKAVRASNGWGYAASDAELEDLTQQLQRTEQLDALPAATAGIAALHFAAKFARLDAGAKHVAIVTAKA